MRPLWLSALVLAACGTPQPPTPPEEKLKVHGTAAAQGSALMQEELATAGTVSAVGMSTDGNLVLVAGDRVYELIAGELTRRSLYAEGADPTTLGAVSSIIPRAKGGAWLASANGLFVVDGEYVTHSPVMVGMGPLSGASEVSQGNLSGLWLAATNGVYRRQASETSRYRIEGYGEAAGAIAADPDGAGALAVLGEELVLLTPGETGPAAAEPPEDVGTVNALASAKGALFAATSKGLYRWQRTATPQWARFTLGDAAASDVKVDPVTGAAWVTTSDALFRLDADALTQFARPMGTEKLAIDRLGDVWTAKGSTLVRLKAGVGAAGASFMTDLKPWLTTHCNACHADFADPVAFKPRAEAALQRVRTGDMPRCNGGVPCPTEQHLKAEQFAVLEAWIRGGKQP